MLPNKAIPPPLLLTLLPSVKFAVDDAVGLLRFNIAPPYDTVNCPVIVSPALATYAAADGDVPDVPLDPGVPV